MQDAPAAKCGSGRRPAFALQRAVVSISHRRLLLQHLMLTAAQVGPYHLSHTRAATCTSSLRRPWNQPIIITIITMIVCEPHLRQSRRRNACCHYAVPCHTLFLAEAKPAAPDSAAPAAAAAAASAGRAPAVASCCWAADWTVVCFAATCAATLRMMWTSHLQSTKLVNTFTV